MASPLDKARNNPKSKKGKILAAARSLFGKYGYHGATTRMIADKVGIDISALYYHWGEKSDLFEAVIQDVNRDIQIAIKEFENKIAGQPLEKRVELSLDTMCDYLFTHPEVSNLILHLYFSKIRNEDFFDLQVPDFINNIAVAMGLALDEQNIPVHAKTGILAIWNSVFNFIAGERIFRPMLNVSHKKYIKVVKETLKFILIPQQMSKSKSKVKLIPG